MLRNIESKTFLNAVTETFMNVVSKSDPQGIEKGHIAVLMLSLGKYDLWLYNYCRKCR